MAIHINYHVGTASDSTKNTLSCALMQSKLLAMHDEDDTGYHKDEDSTFHWFIPLLLILPTFTFYSSIRQFGCSRTLELEQPNHDRVMIQRMIVLWLSILAILVTAQKCYDVNGTVATSGFAENSRKLWKACPNSTTCCLTGGESEDSCFTGGMCFSSTGAAFYRGMCTDQDWASGSGCPNQCLHRKQGSS